jgi:hypothetical protein
LLLFEIVWLQNNGLTPHFVPFFLLVLGAGSSRARGAAAVTASGVVNPPSLVRDLNGTEGDQEQLVNNEEDLNVADGDQEQLVNNEEAVNNNGEAGNHDEAMIDEADVNEEEASASHDQRPNRDVVMENELANELTGDALDDYDIDVGNEGQAIAEYLSLLESAASS